MHCIINEKEINMEKEYFRKVLASDRLPVETNTYITNQDTYTRFDGDDKTWRLDEDQEVEWWLEPCECEAYDSMMAEELPDRDVVSTYADKHSNNFPKGLGDMCNAAENNGVIVGAEWIKRIASGIISRLKETALGWRNMVDEERIIKKAMMKQLGKRDDRIKEMESALLEANSEIQKLKK